MKNLTFFPLVALLLSPLAPLHAAGMADLRCEYLEKPLGIDVTKPRLSWVIADPQSEISNLRSQITRSVRQMAYHVLVASTPELLAKDQGDLWDSGKVDLRGSQISSMGDLGRFPQLKTLIVRPDQLSQEEKNRRRPQVRIE